MTSWMDILNIGGFVLGLIGLISSYIFYKLSIRAKEPSWGVRSINLIRSRTARIENLEIKFLGHDIENLTVSRVLFWNEGAETIDTTDITMANPVKLVFGGNTKVLDARVYAVNNSANQFKARIDEQDNVVFLEFAYLDRKNGAVIQVIHTGTSSEDVQILGDIKGVKVIRNRFSAQHRLSRTIRKLFRSSSRKSTSFMGFIFGVIYIIAGILSVISRDFREMVKAAPQPSDKIDWFLTGMGIVGGVLLLSTWAFEWRSRSFIPKGLEGFFDDVK
ncbi:MAG: hypothetical protein HGB26_07465 [Desulfobulbaceae bacterium]|nr:hypothetical protein [Desulfobulbaceae bacterium]